MMFAVSARFTNAGIARRNVPTIKETAPKRVEPDILPAVEQEPKRNVAAFHRAMAIRETKKILEKNGVPVWVVNLLIEIADKHGLSPADLAGRSRAQPVVRARSELVYRMRERKPALSVCQIGGFLGRDHTGVIHGIALHSRLTGEPKLTEYDLDAALARKARAYREKAVPA